MNSSLTKPTTLSLVPNWNRLDESTVFKIWWTRGVYSCQEFGNIHRQAPDIVTILMMIFISDKPFRKVLQIFTEVGDYELAIVQN